MKPALAALGCLALVGCSVPAPATPTPTPTSTTSTPVATSPTAAATPKGGRLKLGATFEMESATTVVYEAKRIPNRPDGTPAMAALIKTCIIGTDENYTIVWLPWALIGPDSETYEASNVTFSQDPQPALSNDMDKTFPAGKCSKGWVVFEVPKGDAVASVRYQNSSGDTADWAVS